MLKASAFAILLVALVGMSVTSAPADTNVTQYRTSGKSAQFSAYTPGVGSMNVYLTEYWSNANGVLTRYVRMNYSIYDYSTTPYTYNYGYGTIPAGDFIWSGNNASLDTDTADGTWSYQVGGDHTFELDWDGNNMNTYATNGTTRQTYTYPNGTSFRRVRVGVSSRNSAEVEGTVDDDDVAGNGYVYSNNNVSVTLTMSD